jgi:hypothetical protein
LAILSSPHFLVRAFHRSDEITYLVGKVSGNITPSVANQPSRALSLRVPAPLADQPLLPVVAFATMLLTLGASFARSNATFSLSEIHPGLTRDRSNRLLDLLTSPLIFVVLVTEFKFEG